jgi:putative colanic acid biosynthesis glycosyltransferase
MKIFLINSHYNQSGAGKIITSIHKQLQKDGFESMVAYGRGRGTSDKNVYKIGSKLSVYSSVFATRYLGINGFTSKHATKELVKEAKKFNPDIIHLNGLHGYYLNFKILFDYINDNNIPCVWTFHDCHAFSGNCGYHCECEKWKTGCVKCTHLRDYPTSYLFDHTKWMWQQKRNLFTKTDNKIIVSPSDWMTNDAKQSYFGKYPCITINNGIDTEKVFYSRDRVLCRKKYGYKNNDKIVLSIAFGLDDPRKGVKYMIQLAKDLQTENVKLILIGWSDKNNNLIEGLTNVKTIPFTNNQDELAEYYSLADVFVLPSLEENYATVVIESLACGTPVVGFNVGGTPEQLDEGRGIVVEKGNQEQLNEAVIGLLNGYSNVKDSHSIIKDIKSNNSIVAMSTKYEQLYNRLLHKVEKDN